MQPLPLLGQAWDTKKAVLPRVSEIISYTHKEYFTLPDDWNAKISQHKVESSYRISTAMPALINRNIISSRLKRYLFNKGTESNGLSRRGEQAGRRAGAHSFRLLNLTQPFCKGGRSTTGVLPKHVFLPSADNKDILVSLYRVPPARSRAAGGPGEELGYCASAECLPASCPYAAAQPDPRHSTQTLHSLLASEAFKPSI